MSEAPALTARGREFLWRKGMAGLKQSMKFSANMAPWSCCRRVLLGRV